MERPSRWKAPDAASTGVLVRERLLARLARRFDVRLVTIEAGAGFGKSTLLVQALAENRLRPAGDDAWLGCEPADTSASNLLAGLLKALHADLDVATEPTVQTVCEAVWARAPTDVCLVLDDVHLVAPDESGWDAIRALVDELPANGHVVLAGRSLGQLPLQQLLAKDDAVALGEDDLRLDGHELRALASLLGVDPAVVEGTAGWPALVRLRATAGAVPDELLLEELLSTLSPAQRRQFATVVAVGGGNEAMLTAALGEPPDLRALGELPLVRVTRGGLEPHALWQRVVTTELSTDDARDARRRAAAECVARDDHRTAFELLAAAHDWDAALPALFEACHDQVDPPWPDTLARWRAMVPDDLATRAEAVYVEAMIERVRDPWSARAREAFAAAEAQFRARGDVANRLRARFRATTGPWLTADLDFYADNIVMLEEMGGASVPLIEQLMRFVRASVAESRGEHETVLDELDTAFDFEPRLMFLVPLFRSYAHLIAGHGEAARGHATAAREMAAGSTGAWGSQLGALAEPVAAWASGALDDVLTYDLDDPGPRFSISERVPTLATGAVVAAHLGRLDQARARLDLAHHLVSDPGDRLFLVGFLATARATVLAAEGDEPGAAAVLDAMVRQAPLAHSTNGRALVWFGAVPALVDPCASAFVEGLPQGPSRARALQAVDGLRRVRAGERLGDVALLSDPAALLTVLPVNLAVELACAALAERDERGRSAVERFRSIAARATREALQRVATNGTGGMRKAASTLLGEVPIPPPDPVRADVLGPVRLWRRGEPVTDRNWRRDRVRHLLLLLVDRRAVRRAEAADLFWPDLDTDAVSHNLRTTLSYLHGILEPHRRQGEAPYLVQQDAGVLRLADDEFFTVDAWEMEASFDRARAAEDDGLVSIALMHLLDGLDRWQGPYLEDVATEEWAEPSRRRLHARVAGAGIRASELLVAGGRPHDAIRPARIALEADPWSEAAYRALVAASIAAGDQGAAKRAMTECEAMLADLGVGPDATTTELAAQLTR